MLYKLVLKREGSNATTDMDAVLSITLFQGYFEYAFPKLETSLIV